MTGDVNILWPDRAMTKAESFDRNAEKAEQHAREIPKLRAQYLEVANVWRKLARQARLFEQRLPSPKGLFRWPSRFQSNNKKSAD
jgi:hypothetical protein